MRSLVLVIAVFLGTGLTGCATTGTLGERTAQATGTMAVGGGFAAMGTVQLVGAGVFAGLSATSDVQLLSDTFLTGAVIAGATGAVELAIGLFLLHQGGEELADAIDSAARKTTKKLRETDADADEMQE